MENSKDIIQKNGSSLLGEFVVYKWLQMGKFFFVFWIVGHLWEVVAHGCLTVQLTLTNSNPC